MTKKIIHTDKAPAAVGPYVQAIQAGDMLYASGQLGLVPATGELAEGIEGQTRQSLQNVDAILEAAGFTKADVIKTTIYLSDMGNFATVNAIYGEYFKETLPARSCVEVAKLPKNGMVEIEVVAAK